MKIKDLINKLTVLTKHERRDPIIGVQSQCGSMCFAHQIQNIETLNDRWHENPSPQYQGSLIIVALVHEHGDRYAELRTAKNLLDALTKCNPDQDIYIEEQADLLDITDVYTMYILGTYTTVIKTKFLEGYHS